MGDVEHTVPTSLINQLYSYLKYLVEIISQIGVICDYIKL